MEVVVCGVRAVPLVLSQALGGCVWTADHTTAGAALPVDAAPAWDVRPGTMDVMSWMGHGPWRPCARAMSAVRLRPGLSMVLVGCVS